MKEGQQQRIEGRLEMQSYFMNTADSKSLSYRLASTILHSLRPQFE